nr:hypothetical protein [Arthrobacter sp. Y81]
MGKSTRFGHKVVFLYQDQLRVPAIESDVTKELLVGAEGLPTRAAPSAAAAYSSPLSAYDLVADPPFSYIRPDVDYFPGNFVTANHGHHHTAAQGAVPGRNIVRGNAAGHDSNEAFSTERYRIRYGFHLQDIGRSRGFDNDGFQGVSIQLTVQGNVGLFDTLSSL